MEHSYRNTMLALTAFFGLQSASLFAQVPCDLAGTVTVTKPSCGSMNGVLDLTPIGGYPPYYIYWNTGANTEDLTDVGVGSYWVFVTDGTKGCSYQIDVEVTCEDNCNYRTQTQGGWGSPGHGNNPGTYRNTNFAGCFPNGLTIGCNRTLTLTSAQAVQRFLPSGTTPSTLPMNAAMVDPGSTYRNVLAGQLVAATLSVGFDACDPAFGAGSGSLGGLTISNGTFQGWTVQQLINEANSFIGGCSSNYSASQLNSALTQVNENYVDGTTDNGFLDCNSQPIVMSVPHKNTSTNFRAWPNPANELLTYEMSAAMDDKVSLNLHDLSGRPVLETQRFDLTAGDMKRNIIDVSGLANGTYLLTVQGATQNNVRTIVIAR